MSCNPKLKQEHTGLMKSAGWSSGTDTFHVHMPDRQNPRKVTCQTSVFFNFSSSRSFVKSRWLWHLINIISSTYLDSWSNEISLRNLVEKPANFASCRLLCKTLLTSHLLAFKKQHLRVVERASWISIFLELWT